MLKYDSTHGKFFKEVRIEKNFLIIDSHKIRVTAERNIEDISWGEVGAEYIVESSVGHIRDLPKKAISDGKRSTIPKNISPEEKEKLKAMFNQIIKISKLITTIQN